MSFAPLPLHAGNPGPMTGSGNWTYLVPGPESLLIDAGVGGAAHLEAVFAAVPAGPARVIVTHAHHDHIAGAPALAARAPAARFGKWPWPGRDQRYGVSFDPLVDGQIVDTAVGPLEILHTPGHAPDHVALWHADSGSVFTGDLLVQGSTVVIPASAGGSLTAYLASLVRVATLRPRRALPAHGAVIDEPLALIAHYLEHRRRREAQIVDALEANVTLFDAIVARIYRGLSPALLPMAEDSVRAHLQKLVDEGRVRDDAGHWALVRADAGVDRGC